MSNLYLPPIELGQPPEFMNMHKYSFWSLTNDVSKDFLTFDSVFSKQEVFEIIKMGRAFTMDASKTGDGKTFSDIRKSQNSWIPPCEITFSLFEKIHSLVEEANKTFQFKLTSIENLQYTEYSEKYSGNYGPHQDKFEAAAYPNSHRKLSFSIQLSENSSYEGGDLLLYTQKEPIVANRNIGSITFFPSYVLHEVTPVTKGVRYSLVSWCSGPKFQ